MSFAGKAAPAAATPSFATINAAHGAAGRASLKPVTVSSDGKVGSDRASVLEALAGLFKDRELRPPSAALALLLPPTSLYETGPQYKDFAEGETDYVVETLAAAPYAVLGDAGSGSHSGSSSRAAPLLPELSLPSNAAPLLSSSSPSPPSASPSARRTGAKAAASANHGRHRLEAAPQAPLWTPGLVPLTRTLSVLRAILQRSYAAHRHSRNFARLLHVLGDGRFAATAADQMHTLWQRIGGAAGSAQPLAAEQTALSLFCDVLLLLAYHHDHHSASDAGAPRRGEDVKEMVTEATLTKLYALSTSMGAHLVAAPAHPLAHLRQSTSALTSFCILHVTRLPRAVLDDALRDLEGGGERGAEVGLANMAHMAFMAALPTACPSMSQEWQCCALEVVRKATLYDAAADVYCSTDGAATSVVGCLVTTVHGQALQALLSVMSAAAWCYCTADALLHISRAVGAYGATWTTYSTSYTNFVGFLHRALTRYEAQYAQLQEGKTPARLPSQSNKSSPPQLQVSSLSPVAALPDAVVRANRHVAWSPTGPTPWAAALDSLVQLSVLGTDAGAAAAVPSTAAGSSTGTADAYSAFRPGGAFVEAGGAVYDGSDTNPEAYLARCEAEPDSPRSFVFYLSLLAYTTAALPQTLRSFEELRRFFHLSAVAAAAAGDEEGGEATDRQLFALCVRLLSATLPSVQADCSTGMSKEDAQAQLLCESTATLLCAFMCAFPHSLQAFERATGATRLVDAVTQLVAAIAAAPHPSLRLKHTAYQLLRRYASAVEALDAVAARLLASSHWASLGSATEFAEADLCACVHLYQHLCCTAVEAGTVRPGRLLSLLAELPAGAFSCSAGGAATATTLVHAMFTMLEENEGGDAALFGDVTVAQLPALIARLGEALDALLQASAAGYVVAAGQSTWHSACAAATLLYRVVLAYRVPALAATAVFPVPGEVALGWCDAAGSPRPRRSRCLVQVLLELLCSDAVAAVHHVAAELLVAAVHATAVQQGTDGALEVLRSCASPAELAGRVLRVQREAFGAPSNAVRLEVLLAMAKWCPALFLLLFGPARPDDGDDEDERRDGKNGAAAAGGDNDGKRAGPAAATQPSELPLMRLLVATVRADNAVLYEKAVALHVLRCCGMATLVPLQEVVALVPRDDGDADVGGGTASGGAGEWEEAALTVACVAYVNARVALELAKAKPAAVDVGNAGGDTEGTTRATPRTPHRRPNSVPLSPAVAPSSAAAASSVASLQTAARRKALAAYTDAMDQLLRHGAAAVQRARHAYDAELAKLHYAEAVPWSTRQTASLVLADSSNMSINVVVPRGSRAAAQRWASSNQGSNASALARTQLSSTTVLSRSAAPRALIAASATVSASVQAMNGLHELSTHDAEAVAAQQRLCPVGTAAGRFFRCTDDDRRLNTLAALLDAMADLATALEQLVWFSGAEASAVAGLFGKRTQQVLEGAVAAVLSSQPAAPVLSPFVARQVQQQLRLARAATAVLEVAVSEDDAESLEMGAALQSALRRLVAYVKANRAHVAFVVDTLPIITAFPPTTVAANAAAGELADTLQMALQDQLLADSWTTETLVLLDGLLDGCVRLFSQPRSEGGCDPLFVSRLLPTMLQLAARLAGSVQPTQPSNAASQRFVRVVECIDCVVARCGGHVAVLGFLVEDVLLRFLQALGQLTASAVYDAAAQRHVRLGWHVCWLAVVSLWGTVLAVRGTYNAVASGWVPSLKAALLSNPRFSAALSAFAGPHGADRDALLVWEVEEVTVCTRLAAALAAQGTVLDALTPCVQAAFVFLQQPHLQQHCVASLPSTETAVSEGRRITVAQTHALRHVLTVLLRHSAYAIPRDGAAVAAFAFAPELLLGAAAGSPRADGPPAQTSPATRFVLSLEVLRQFTVRELQVLRRVTAASAGSGGVGGPFERSPDAGRPSAVSRESSATRSPSRGALTPDGDAATEPDDAATVEGQVDVAAEVQSVHLGTVQLALTAYTLTLEDFVQHAGAAPGVLYTAAVLQAAQRTTERLVRTLRLLLKELQELRWPLLSRVVHTQTAKLEQLIGRL